VAETQAHGHRLLAGRTDKTRLGFGGMTSDVLGPSSI
jgi:hypothetical protein